MAAQDPGHLFEVPKNGLWCKDTVPTMALSHDIHQLLHGFMAKCHDVHYWLFAMLLKKKKKIFQSLNQSKYLYVILMTSL